MANLADTSRAPEPYLGPITRSRAKRLAEEALEAENPPNNTQAPEEAGTDSGDSESEVERVPVAVTQGLRGWGTHFRFTFVQYVDIYMHDYARTTRARVLGKRRKPAHAEHNMKVCIYEVHQMSRHVRSMKRGPNTKASQESHVRDLFDAVVLLDNNEEDEDLLYPQLGSPMHEALKVVGRRMGRVIQKFSRRVLEDKKGHYTTSDGEISDWDLSGWLHVWDIKGFRREDGF